MTWSDHMTTEKPKRRERYKGTYPKTFNQKYKEQNPEKYQETILKVIEKGNTPAGMHRPIMTTEILDFFDIKEGQIGLDLTLGYGGHTSQMLNVLNHKGHLHATDQDPIELPKTKERLESQGFTSSDFTLHHLNFKDLDLIGQTFDFILADLGVSSMQIDDPKRGFTFKQDGPLDLRMNPSEGVPASIRLQELTTDEIEGMLIENADEVYAHQIALEITKEKHSGNPIDTTKALYQIIKNALSFLPKNDRDDATKKAATRTFQALRIDVNSEYEVLFELLDKLPNFLNPGGKVAILSFHSGEDRLVKKAFKHFYNEGIYKQIDGPISPSNDEIYQNPRSRSAKLRTAIKT